MKIEFNPSRATNPAAAQPAAQPPAAQPAGDTASLGNSEALKAAVNNVSLVRADKVAAANALVADPNFPTDAMLRSVASIIAGKI
jgi:ABC-type uncharacterized transport system involved in gliding motility auxiliary subunit